MCSADPVSGPLSLAAMGALIGDPVRASILLHLGDGSRRPAGELASLAGASPQAVSAHLARLLEGGLLVVEPQGRHRFYRIASGEVAEVIEGLANVLGQAPNHVRHPPALRRARLCYDHLAGRLGVSVFERLVGSGRLILGPDGPALSESGLAWCRHCGLDPAVPGSSRRVPFRLCLDWTERRHHLGGRFGAAFARMMVDRGYLTCGPPRRAVDLTAAGRAFLDRELALEAIC